MRIQFTDSAAAWSREPAVGDTLALRATYYDSAGFALPGKAVSSWTLERPSAYYALASDGVVIPLKAGDGAAYTMVSAVIDGVRGEYPLSYRVLGWIPDTTVDLSRQRTDVGVRLATGFRDARPPQSRRKGLNSDRDAVLTLRCGAPGRLDVSVMLPELAQSGDIMFEPVGARAITERWMPSADPYTLVYPGDSRALLGHMLSSRNFRLSYTTVDGRSIAGLFPGGDPVHATVVVTERCR